MYCTFYVYVYIDVLSEINFIINIITFIWTLEAKAFLVHKAYEVLIGLDDNCVKYCQNIGAQPDTHMYPHTCTYMYTHVHARALKGQKGNAIV